MLSLLSTIAFWAGVIYLASFYSKRWNYKRKRPRYVAHNAETWVYYLRGWFFFDRKYRPMIESNDVSLITLVKEGEVVKPGQDIVQVSATIRKGKKSKVISFNIAGSHRGTVHHIHKQWQALSIDEELFSIEKLTEKSPVEKVKAPQVIEKIPIKGNTSTKAEAEEVRTVNPGNNPTIEQKSESLMANKDIVPEWEHRYIYGTDDLASATKQQKDFYELFKSRFLDGEFLDLKGNSNYSFTLLFDLADMPATKENYTILEKRLSLLAEKYPEVAPYTSRVLSKFYKTILKEDSERIAANKSNDKSSQKARWIKSGESETISGITISRGMFYLGEVYDVPGNHYVNYRWEHKSISILSPVISPSAEVSSVETAYSPFSAYATMNSYMRYKYLMWLSGERGVDDIDISFIFLYVLGLEIRLFIDPSCPKKEKVEIVREFCRIYEELRSDGENYEYHRLQDLISNAILSISSDNPLEFIRKDRVFDFPDLAAEVIRQRKLEGKLTKDVMFDIADEYYGFTEMVPPGNKDALKKEFTNFLSSTNDDYHSYYSDNSARHYYCGSQLGTTLFEHDCDGVFFTIDTPSSYNERNTYYGITSAANRIYWALDKYRKIVNNNNGVTSAYAVMNFPPYIDISKTEEMSELKSKVEKEFDYSGFALVKVMDLIEWIKYPTREEKGIYKPYAEAIERGINMIGLGISPSPRIDGDRLMYDGFCCFYKLKGDGSLGDVHKGQLASKMAIAEVQSDSVSRNDLILIDESLKSYATEGDTLNYLRAFTRQLSELPKKPFSLKNLNDWSEYEIQSAYEMLLRLAINNGEISDKRVKVIQKYCKVLGKDPGSVHSGIHSVMTSGEFATIERTTGAVSYTIPKPSEVVNKFSLDETRLKYMEKQTKDAQEMLSDIFTEETEMPVVTPKNTDDVMKEIMTILLQKEVWDIQEVESICKDKGQMTGSILEKINDYSYEKIDDAVIEQDGDNVYITTDYKEQLI